MRHCWSRSLRDGTRLAACICSIPFVVTTAVFAQAQPFTLQEAWKLADSANSTLRTARSNLEGLEAQYSETRGALWNNPQLSTEQVRRSVPATATPGDRQYEWAIGLAQTFEIAGQQSYRRAAAEQELLAARFALDEARSQIRSEVAQRFAQVLALQNRMAMEQSNLELIERATTLVRKRVDAGEGTRLEGNLAKVEAERARNQLAILGEQLLQAQFELATLLQLPPQARPQASPAAMQQSTYTLDQLLASVADRPLLQGLDRRMLAARSKLGLERAAATPDITIGLSAGREGPGDARERLAGLSVSVPLPLFRRNQGAIGRASAELTNVQIERQTTAREAQAAVVAQWEKVTSLRDRVRRLNELVLPSLEENQRLSNAALQAGELNLMELLVVNRQVLEARRDVVDASSELILAQVELERAAGWPPAKDFNSTERNPPLERQK